MRLEGFEAKIAKSDISIFEEEAVHGKETFADAVSVYIKYDLELITASWGVSSMYPVIKEIGVEYELSHPDGESEMHDISLSDFEKSWEFSFTESGETVIPHDVEIFLSQKKLTVTF